MNGTQFIEAKRFVSNYLKKKEIRLEVDEVINNAYVQIYEKGIPYNNDVFIKHALDIIHNSIRLKPNIISLEAINTKKGNDTFNQQCPHCGEVKHMDEFSSSVSPLGKIKYKKTCKSCINLKDRAARGVNRPVFELKDSEEIYCFDNGYSVTNSGRAIEINGKMLTPQKMKNGYIRVSWGNRKRMYLHRLVALAFIPNPFNRPEVNHKDGNKENNHYSNLEWATHKQNIEHAYKVLMVHMSPRNIQKNRSRIRKMDGKYKRAV